MMAQNTFLNMPLGKQFYNIYADIPKYKRRRKKIIYIKRNWF